MARDYYEILEISREATQEEVKKAYRRLARKYHPDANPDDPDAERKFKELAEAYSVLSDGARRRDYDLFGTARVPLGGFDPFDIFASFFGTDPFASFTRQRRPQRGSDLIAEVQVTLEEVVKGASKTFTIRNLQTCQRCDGSGCEPGTYPTRCSRCGGSGSVRSMQRSFFGNIMTSFTCPSCHGEGEEILTPCTECNGDGRLERLDEISVDIPPGVEDGINLRLSGRGQAGPRGTSSGDLFVQIRALPHDHFDRQGDDLITSLTLPFTQATLGATVEIEALDGPAELTIAGGTQPGDVVRIRGRGIPRRARAGRGDLLVQVQVEVPRRLSPEQDELIRRLAAERGEKVGEASRIIGKIRGAFRR